MWDAAKAFFAYIFKWFCFIACIYFAFGMAVLFFTETSGIWKPTENQIVEEKFMHKGLYFSKNYYVTLSNGETHGVFKHTFNALEKGDAFEPFFSAVSWKDFWLITFITVVIFISCLGFAYLFASLIFYKKNWFQKLEDKRKKLIVWFISLVQKSEKTEERWKKWSALIFIISLIIPYVLMAKNVAIKITPIGKETTIAEITDSEIVKSTGVRAPSDTYTLTYTFTDKNNQTYKTKKNVSSYTYHTYANAPNIPIYYRKTFPYETFIDTKSPREVVSTLFRSSNFTLLINVILLIYFIKKFIGAWGIPFVRKK